jgi:hypothetical protein
MSTILRSNSRFTAQRASTLTGACLQSCRKLVAQLRGAKERVVAEFKAQVEDHEHLLELAVNEAEALAWHAGFPHLLFPELAEEKARTVAAWHERQQFLLEKSDPIAVAA